MGEVLDARRVASLRAGSKIAALVTFVGSLVMLGWALDIAALKSIVPNLVSMKANTALCFILLGAGLWLSNAARNDVSKVLGGLVALIGLLTLCEYVFGWNPGIDQLLFKEPAGAVAASTPGRMAPNTAVSFLFVGLALLLLDSRITLSRVFAVLGGLIGLLAVIGYTYGVVGFREVGHYTSMALNTAITFVVFSIGFICARPERGIIAIVASDTPGATVLRRMLPITLGVAFVLGWLVSWGERAGVYGSTEGTAIFTILLMIVLASLAVLAGTRLHKADGERQKAQEKVHNIALFPEQNPNPTMRMGVRGDVLYANRSAKDLLGSLGWEPGQPAPEVLGLPVQTALETDAHGLTEFRDPSDHVFSFEVIPITAEGYVNLYGRDITVRKEAEEALSRALAELRARSEALDSANEELQVVNEEIAAQNEELLTEMDERKRVEAELREAKDHLEIWVKERTTELEQAVRTLSEEVIERIRAEQAVASERQRFNDVLETLPAYLVLLTPDYHVPFANRFFRERFGESEGRRCYEYLFGRDEPCEICETYTVMKTSAPHRWEWTGPDGRNYDIYDFPFTDTDGSTLIMEMGIDITERKQAETELEKHRDHLGELVHERTNELETANVHLLGEITERAKAEEALHSQVRSLQRALLPPKPLVIPGYDLAFKYIPAFAGEEIGGDFYDIFRTEEGKVGILIGDVSGKGIQAAAMAAGTRSTVRAFAYEYSAPAEAMEHANRLLTAQQPSFETFVTLFLLILDPETGHVIYSSAGHPPALVRRANAKIELFSGRNMPLGVIGGQTYDQAESSLNPGDKIVLYTDGVTEARQGASLFGVEGLRDVVAEHGGKGPTALTDQIIAQATDFAQGKLRDDTAVVVIQRMEANGL